VTARTAPGDSATVTVTVDVRQDAAFDVFTREIDLWWKRGPAYRQVVRGGIVRLEPGVGGRVFEADDAGHVFERGHVTLWGAHERHDRSVVGRAHDRDAASRVGARVAGNATPSAEDVADAKDYGSRMGVHGLRASPATPISAAS
jgi:hypothetical protein